MLQQLLLSKSQACFLPNYALRTSNSSHRLALRVYIEYNTEYFCKLQQTRQRTGHFAIYLKPAEREVFVAFVFGLQNFTVAGSNEHAERIVLQSENVFRPR